MAYRRIPATKQRPDPVAQAAVPLLERPESFNWTLVKSFLAVLDAGSLMGAARALRAQQPTLSRHVAELEAQLRVPLFERTGRGVTPTAAALAIADAARQMQSGALDLLQGLHRARNSTSGTVRITTSHVAATWLLPPLLTRLQREEPGIQIELVVSNQISNLIRREADIAVRMARPEQSSLVARKLFDIPIVAAAHESYLTVAGTPRRPEELIRHRLIGYERDDTIERGFAAMGLPIAREQFAIRTDDQIAYGCLVASGAGIGFVTNYTLRHWPGVVPVLPQLNIPPLPCWLAVHREIRGNRLVRRVFDFLAEHIVGALQSAQT
ncbi:MAG: LysR family transcriptional regulator [Burkholderiales bacterium]|jgi:DNA-binding transcriptional LysR family regulator|nr:LysR family transcriptional regulator [Burkholderiales bacterium]